MLMTYDSLSAADLRGNTLADLLIAIEADFRLVDGGVTIYEEPSFPVVELARSLHLWMAQADHEDFMFDSMSFEELGALTVRRAASGWAFGSVFNPEVVGEPVPWADVEQCVRAFASKVAADLAELGIDAAEVFR